METTQIHDWMFGIGVHIGTAILISFVGWWIANRVYKLSKQALKKGKLNDEVSYFLSLVAYYLIIIFTGFIAIGELGVSTASLMALFGTVGLGIGLSLKDQIAQFAAGVVLLFKHPFKINDLITVSGHTGRVEGIELLQTILKTTDNQKVIIPNTTIMNNVVTNITAYPIRRLDVVIGLSYDDDLLKGIEVLKRIIDEEEMALKDPDPQVIVTELAESRILVTIRCWVETKNFIKLRVHLLKMSKIKLLEEGFVIPFPRQDVHLHQN